MYHHPHTSATNTTSAASAAPNHKPTSSQIGMFNLLTKMKENSLCISMLGDVSKKYKTFLEAICGLDAKTCTYLRLTLYKPVLEGL